MRCIVDTSTALPSRHSIALLLGLSSRRLIGRQGLTTILYSVKYRSCTHCRWYRSTRVNHNTIVYKYRSCTHCRWYRSTRVNHNTIVYQYRSVHIVAVLYHHTIHIQLYSVGANQTVSTNHKSADLYLLSPVVATSSFPAAVATATHAVGEPTRSGVRGPRLRRAR